MTITVQKAIIPAAGKGSRMFPFSQFLHKELLPYGVPGHPMIWHTVRELEESGIREIAMVIRKDKEEIRKYLTKIFGRRLEFTFCYQNSPTGIVDALLTAKSFVKDDYFLLLFPDHLLKAKVPAALQLIKQTKKDGVWESAVKVPQMEAKYFPKTFGVLFSKKPTVSQSNNISEKEANKVFNGHPYQWRSFGRTVYPSGFFECLKYYRGKDSEGMKNAYWRFIKEVNHFVVPLKGSPMDLGTIRGYAYYTTRQIASLVSKKH